MQNISETVLQTNMHIQDEVNMVLDGDAAASPLKYSSYVHRTIGNVQLCTLYHTGNNFINDLHVFVNYTKKDVGNTATWLLTI